ncbi:MAG: methyltransferase domain-containing protein [Nanoarchaeota archaeon]
MKKLHLGCGKNIRMGYVNLDLINLKGVDVVHNLNIYPWPFKKNEFDYVFTSHVLEHLDGIIKPMEEIWRITKNKTIISIEVPIFPSIGAMADPTHKQFYTFRTFDYFRPVDSLNYYSKARFNVLSKRILFSRPLFFFGWFFNLSPSMQRFYINFLSFLIPAFALKIELETIK